MRAGAGGDGRDPVRPVSPDPHEATRQGVIDITTTPQRYVHRSVRTNPRHATRVRDHRGTAPRTGPALRGAVGPQPVAPGTEARGFVVYVGLDESGASAAGTSLTRLATKLRHYVESIVAGSQTTAAVAIAPAGAPGTDLEVVHQVLGGPATQPEAGPVQAPAPASTGQPGVLIDLPRRQVQLDGQVLKLTHKEFEILHYLLENQGRTVDRVELIDALWTDDEQVPDERTIDVHIRRLRTKLGRLATTVRTVRGQGYRFAEHPDVIVRSTVECSI